MRILLTGASSFSGYWFARSLAAAKHEVVAPLRGTPDSYREGVRGERVRLLRELAEVVYEASFGAVRFLDLAAAGRWDLLCHHAARVGNYRSPDFDVLGAVAENTHHLPEMLKIMLGRGLSGMVLTGSVFEQGEGAGTAPLRAFSPYGLAKGLTAQIVRYWCGAFGVPLGKFVIPNPFGPLEEPRFCAYLLRSWKARQAADVRTPLYVRDNVPVDLLAKAYTVFAARCAGGAAFVRLNPSFYVESQGAFAQRLAHEMGRRLGVRCELRLLEQTDRSEPMVRINTDRATELVPEWSEEAAWAAYAASYGAT